MIRAIRFPVPAALALVATAMLLALAPGRGEAGRPARAVDHLANLKLGHWIQIEGAARGTEPALCTDVRLLTGDFLDDDWSIEGTVQAVDVKKREIIISGVHVQVPENVSFESSSKAFKGFLDIVPGMLLEVGGTYLRNRIFLAKEIDDESDDNERKPWGRDQILIVGKIEGVDSRKRLLSAMGFTFQVTEKTRLRSVIQ